MIAQPDAGGGLGSLPGSLLGDLTQGLRMIAAGELSKRYGYSFGADGRVALNANDGLRPAASPGSEVAALDVARDALRSPLIVAVLAAVGVGLAFMLIRR